MKVLQVHNFYQQSGGETRVLEQEATLLSAHGHDVDRFSVSNDAIRNPLKKLQTAWGVTYSPGARQQLARHLLDNGPDIVHVHNFFPLLSPAVFDACQAAGVPVVLTLHNYRNICPGALLVRNGRVCEQCVIGSAYQAVLYGCYRGSALGTLPVAHMVEHHRRKETWKRKIDGFIVLSEFSRQKFIQAGFPADKLLLKPNFCEATPMNLLMGERQGALFAGRLSEEKGIRTLLEAWRGLNVPLRIVGGGPLETIIEAEANPAITLVGRLAPKEVADEMRKAAYLIVPSESYETFGLVVIEAFSAGLPVIASNLGAVRELVTESENGLLFAMGSASELASRVRWASLHPTEMASMGLKARQTYDDYYTPERNYELMLSIYQSVIQQKRSEQIAAQH